MSMRWNEGTGEASASGAMSGRWVRRGSTLVLLGVGQGRPRRRRYEFEEELFETSQPTLRRGSRGSAVMDLQRRLTQAGFNPGPVDGIFGQGTDSAVRAFQRARGLSVDGIVGPNTWAALGSPSTPGGPVTPPPSGSRTVDGYVNGVRRSITVSAVPNGKSMRTDAAAAFNRMHAAARQEGIELRVNSAFRTMAEQEALYAAYLNGTGNLAARPGYSNHQGGIAADISVGSTSSSTYQWLKRNASRFGFVRTVSSEPWHWEYRPGGEGAIALEFEEELFEASQPTLRRGSRGDAVRDLQQRLLGAGFNPGPVDGIFGQGTDGAVRAFQRSRGLAVDGIVGPLTWAALGSPTPSGPVTPTADRWVLPAHIRLAGEAQLVRYDGPPAWDGGRNCTGSFTAGAAALRRYILANFQGVTAIGGYSCRQNTANLSETSVHGTGRALDIMIPTVGGRANTAVGDPIANWLVSNAAVMGVQFVIWNRVSWGGHRTRPKERPYTGPSPHIDHIHVELNLAGASRSTPWFATQP